MAWVRLRGGPCDRLVGHRGTGRLSGAPAPITLAEYAALVKSSLLDVAPVPEVPESQMGHGARFMASTILQQGALPPNLLRAHQNQF